MGNRDGALEFISAYVHRAAHNAGIAIQIGRVKNSVGIVACVDAGGTGLKAQIDPPVGIYEQRRIGEVAAPAWGQRRRGAVIQGAGGVIPAAGRAVVMDDAVVERAKVGPAAVRGSRIARQRAVVERAIVGPATPLRGRIGCQQTVPQRGIHCPTAVNSRIGLERAIVQRAGNCPAADKRSRIARQRAVGERDRVDPGAFAGRIARQRAVGECAIVGSAAAVGSRIAT